MEELRGSLCLVVATGFTLVINKSHCGGTAVQSLRRYPEELTATEINGIVIVRDSVIRKMHMGGNVCTRVSSEVQVQPEYRPICSSVDSRKTEYLCALLVKLPGSNASTKAIANPLQTLNTIGTLLR